MQSNDLIALLGTPYYQSPNCLIYQGDCITLLKQMPPESIALTVTSPPYNIGKAYETPLPLTDYLAWCETWLQAIHRITSPNGSFWLNLGYLPVPDRAKALPIAYLLWDKIPFYFVQEIVWHYGAGVAGRYFFSPRNEKFLWYVKNSQDYIFNLDAVRDPNVKYPNQKKNGKLKVNPAGKNPGDVWHFPKVTSGQNRSSKERTAHPAQFPLAVIERIIHASSLPEQWILDPFIGSGSTAVAALSLGRRVIGFDIKAEYCEMAATRIEKALTQPRQKLLFEG